MGNVEIITLSEKGQVVLPKKVRDDLKLKQGTKLLLVEKSGKICLTKADALFKEKNASAILSEKSLAKAWLSKEEDEAWKCL